MPTKLASFGIIIQGPEQNIAKLPADEARRLQIELSQEGLDGQPMVRGDALENSGQGAGFDGMMVRNNFVIFSP
jgi:hypothetical protein